MTKKQKISTLQLFSILYVSRILLTLTFMPSLNNDSVNTDLLLQVVGFFFVLPITALPFYFLYRQQPEWNILDHAYALSPVIEKILAVGYAIYFLYGTIIAISRFDLFATSRLFPDSDFTIFLLLIILVCCIAAAYGLEALGRATVCGLFVVISVFLFVVGALISKFDFLNFTPFFYDGVKPVLRGITVSVSQTIELAVLYVLAPRVQGNLVKGFFKWLIGLLITLIGLLGTTVAVLGYYADSQLFPIHALSVLAQFNVLQRLDAFLTGVWMICLFIKGSVFIMLSSECLQRAFNFKKITPEIAFSGVVVSIVCIYVSQNIGKFRNLVKDSISDVLFAFFVLIVPICLLVFGRSKKFSKKGLKKSES